MSTERLPMRNIREVVRLRWQLGLTVREAARSLGVSVGVVSKMGARATTAGLTWAVVEGLDDPALEERLYGRPVALTAERARPDPIYIHRASTPRRDAGAAAPRVPRAASRRPSLHGVLRRVSTVARDGGRDDAAGAQGRREVLRRLLGRARDVRRPADGRGGRGRALRGGARCVELHVCASDGDATGR